MVREWRSLQPLHTVVSMCSTGIAAINLGDAVTINSTLGYFDTADLQQKYTHGMLQQRLRRLRQAGIRRFILDEVSMLDADQLTCLVRAFNELNGEAEILADPDRQIGLTLVGDFLQLPPVQGKYAFTSPEWHYFEKGIERLTEIRRQGDHDFIQALRAARSEDPDGLVEYFRSRMERFQDTHFQGVTIVAKNAAVDRLNQLRHDELPGSPEVFSNSRWGQERGEWKNIPAELRLKPGALVMVLANQYEGDAGLRQLICANGDNGIFMGKDDAGNAVVQLDRSPDHPVHVKWITREHKQARKDGPRYVCISKDCATEVPNGHVKKCPNCGSGIKKDLYEVLGEVTYMPLRLAYASTVHKTQGLTLDRVQITISDPFFSAPGMLYVALSRARNPEGLRLVGTPELLRSRCRMDPAVRSWR